MRKNSDSPYMQKLRDPRWQRKRLEVLQRDDFTCRNCGAGDRTLHVHHVEYISGADPWECSLEYLLTLCEDCHEMETENRRIAEGDLLRALRHAGITWEGVVDLAVMIQGTDPVRSMLLPHRNGALELVPYLPEEYDAWVRARENFMLAAGTPPAE